MKKSILAYLIAIPLFISGNSHATSLGNENCESLLLVSSYDQDNVKIFDGCSGEYIKDLDDQNIISGAQGIIELPNGNILVASEKNKKLVAFDGDTLSQGEVVVDWSTEGFIDTPLGLALDDTNHVYVASYSENKIVKIDTVTWQVKSTLLASDNNLIKGIDAGTVIDDGYLYAPGYDSDNVIRINLDTQQATELVKSGAQGLDRARGITINQDELFVTSEGTGEIKVFNKNTGAFLRSMSTSTLPAGVAMDGEQHLIYNNRGGVYRMTLSGGDNTMITQSGSGLKGATFVFRLYKNLDEDQDGLTDSDEVDIHGTDPSNSDTDLDGLSDGWEVEHQLNPLINDANEDADADGLSNGLEFENQTNPQKSDTDEDGDNDLIDELPLTPSTQPTLTGKADNSVLQDESYSFAPTLNYPGKRSQVTFMIENKPQWAEFSTTTGELTGTPTNEDVTQYNQILITATNGHASDELAPFSIEVVNVNDMPEQTSALSNDVTTYLVDADISIDFTQYFTDKDEGDLLVFSSADLPESLNLTEAGLLTGKHAQAEQISFSLTVTDMLGAVLTKPISLSITAQAVVEPTPSPKSKSGGGAIFTLLSMLFGLYLYRR